MSEDTSGLVTQAAVDAGYAKAAGLKLTDPGWLEAVLAAAAPYIAAQARRDRDGEPCEHASYVAAEARAPLLLALQEIGQLTGYGHTGTVHDAVDIARRALSVKWMEADAT